MIDSTLQAVTQPDAGATDPLHELLRKGARDLIAKAVEAELSTFLGTVRNKDTGRRPSRPSSCKRLPARAHGADWHRRCRGQGAPGP